MIRPEIAALAVPVVDLRIHPSNPRRGNVEAISASLRAFGQMRPIVVQREGMTIVAGNHTYIAAVEEGWPEIAAIVLDLDDEQATRYLLADNRASDYGTYDEAILAEVLRDLASTGTLEGTGWTGDDLDDLLRDIALDSGNDDGDAPADRRTTSWPDVSDVETKIRCPKCGYEW